MHPIRDYASRIDHVSAALRAAQVDLYLQPMTDEFQGEYTPPHAMRLPYLTGFTGSAGLGAFWADASHHLHALFTDGRYSIQAARELEGTAVDALNSGDVTLAQWLTREGVAGQGLRIGVDPWLISRAQFLRWQAETAALGVQWVEMARNPVDALWVDRPATPAGEVRLQPLALAGQSTQEKCASITAALATHGVDGAILTLPDGINWLLNIRGADIPFNPLLIGYAILQRTGPITLYTYARTFTPQLLEYFREHNVVLATIDMIFTQQKLGEAGGTFLIDPNVSAQGWWHVAQAHGWQLYTGDDPTLLPKACKNLVELDGARAAHRRDGVALSQCLCWLDGEVAAGRVPDELTVVATLATYRARDNRYRGDSFATIAGSGANGAIVHYRADAASNRRLRKGELLLLDSGGQYDDGTTDVTRTIAIGGASPRMCEHFTLVLRGHIALATAIFPEGTTGQQLDALARQFLWQAGLDYDHGTGHGVGAYLCVHEGPQRISKKGSAVALRAGMILSNEPGYYAAGQYGIRIENLVAVVAVGAMEDGKTLLGFETLTLAPIDTRLVVVSMLTNTERNWLNAYHRRVYDAHADAMHADEKQWLANATRAI